MKQIPYYLYIIEQWTKYTIVDYVQLYVSLDKKKL